MNFFEHQESARKQSRWLILAFILAVAAIVVAVNGVILLALGLISFDAETASVPFREVVRQNLPTLDRTQYAAADGVLKGGYVLDDEDGAELALIASGSSPVKAPRRERST